jgi:hypothetical protein
MMTPVSNLDDDAPLRRCVCGLSLVATVCLCLTLATVVFPDGLQGCISRFWLAGFMLINWSTLFYLTNELVILKWAHGSWEICHLRLFLKEVVSLRHWPIFSINYGKVWIELSLTYTLLIFLSFSFLDLSKGIIYGFETLCTTKTLQLEHDKNSSEFFVQFEIFKILKFKRICLYI